MRRNRVDPEGELHAVPQRLVWMGNRGCLHDSEGQIRRHHRGRRWITCVTAFRGRQRDPMPAGRYTALFFLDEATAYAAGHRPCAECRHADWQRFRALWAESFGDSRADAIDAALHTARWDGTGRVLVPVDPPQVPAGAMIRDAGGPVLRTPTGWARWSFNGYRPAPMPKGPVPLLTPAPLVRLMARGLPVQIDPTAAG
ncbi:hypothetical protein C4N9_06115 [Pararhodobacter marinus]|uniref:Metal-binding protein n=1 Tax=Pararhodobacter marinus TaxID=2184063 RepID=A0A2U2CEE0_9RHOB|nr:hypothetical protein [Pararhodobacter marinus]PWE30265.1 hypothetical protein C4N9_06115 [Pararhodobacter marinus]